MHYISSIDQIAGYSIAVCICFDRCSLVIGAIIITALRLQIHLKSCVILRVILFLRRIIRLLFHSNLSFDRYICEISLKQNRCKFICFSGSINL